MSIEDLYRQISNKLFETFYVDDLKYGRQQIDGSYKLIKERITPVTVEDMLKKQKSLLTYQELHIVDTALIKWICLDLDIIKSEIDSNEVNEDNLKSVKRTADAVSTFLDSKKISHLVEFSGRRGFHIWVIFDRLITKSDGYNLINYIFSNVRESFDKIIVADKFPKTPFVSKNSKGIGYGIKLPLSQNKTNQKLSFFINREEYFEFDQNKWLSSPDLAFLIKQLEILSKLELTTYDQIEPYIEEYSSNRTLSLSYSFLKTRKITSNISNSLKLEDILLSLKKCDHLRSILNDFEKGLENKERGILVGLLGQLKTSENVNFGRDLLVELFSKIRGYNEEITLKKIETLKYFQPITCKSLGKCSACNDCLLISPVELIEGLILESIPKYSIKNIDNIIFNKIKNSLHQYSYKNDEVPLYPQLEIIKNLEFEEIKKQIENIYNGNADQNFEAYKFERNEIIKIRKLYNIDPVNNFISVYFTFILSTIYFSEISNNSYGYEFSNSFYKNNIFNNWFINWAKYTKKIETILYNSEYQKYHLIKLDIKNFYDRVDINRLKIKLFEEAPLNIKNKLDELSENDITKYKYIIDYLIDLSVQTTGDKEKGLPQGPAYARYLAEIYLIGLDKLIENKFIVDQKREFYNRFVDDVFIFVESEERALLLFDKIKEWLSINNLEFNYEKTKIVNVKEYTESGEYHKFKDNVKYDINYVNKNKNTLSEAEIQEALSKLETLTDDFKFGLKDNLRFFYSQFNKDKRLDFLRKKLSKKLPFTNDGRGTLYLLFYSNLFENFPNEFWILINDIDKITGLSLSHYLNTILLNDDVHNSRITEIDILLNKMSLRKDLSEADQLLIASLAFKTNNPIKLNYSEKIMYSAIQIPNMELTILHWDLMEKKLRDEDDSTLLYELDKIINKQEHTKDFLNKLANYSFIRFSEWDSKNPAFLLNEATLGMFYQILSFLTLFENSTANTSVIVAWKLLLNKSAEHGDISNKKHQFLWINKIEKFEYNDFSSNSYSIILSNKTGAKLSEINCQNEFLEQYRNLLIVLLFDKDKVNDLSHFKADVLSKIESKDSLFFDWISNPNAMLYPEQDDICLKNIALNGLIILKNNNKIFVKNIYNKIDVKKFDYLNINSSYNPEEYEIEYEIPAENLALVLKATSFYEFIKKLNEVIETHSNFSKKYKTEKPVFYTPFNSLSSLPIIPFYSLYKQVINGIGNIVEINITSYWQIISNLIDKVDDRENIRLISEKSVFNFNIKNLEERFYPKSGSIAFSEESKIDFIKAFVMNIQTDYFTIFQYQYVWSVTNFKIAENLNNGNKDIINYLQIHFQNYTDDNIEIDLFFSIDENLEIKDSSLLNFYETILHSISIFQNQTKLSDINFVEIINEFVLHDLSIYSIEEEENQTIKISELHKNNLSITEGRDLLSKTTFFKLFIDSIENVDIKELYLFNHSANRFQLENIQDLKDKLRGISHYILLRGEKLFIYTPEKELLKCFDRISQRLSLYNQVHNQPNNTNSIPDISEFLSVFPENKDFSSIKDIVLNFSNISEVNEKLKLHYKSTFNVLDRITNWLSLFNKESIKNSLLEKYMEERKIQLPFLYTSILTVLSKHINISQNHINSFRDKIKEISSFEDSIVLPIKNPLNDGNGLKRLLEKSGFEDRSFNWEKNFSLVCTTASVTVKKIIIITDVAISGSQTTKAFEYYMREHSNIESLIEFNNVKNGKPKSPKEERYFLFSNIEESTSFREKIQKCEEIIFVSSIMTEVYESKIKEYFKDINPGVSFQKFEHSLKLDEYLYGNILYNKIQKDLFEILISDVDLISKIFSMSPLEKSGYKKSLKDLGKANLILRIGSLPAKHLKLFTLQPNKGLPLFDYINNW